MRLALRTPVALSVAVLASCFPSLEDRACDAEHACLDGWVCVDELCVPEGELPVDGGDAVDAGFDAGPVDAGARDAGADGGERVDGGVDGGPVDGGPVDAGPLDAGTDGGTPPLDAGPCTSVADCPVGFACAPGEFVGGPVDLHCVARLDAGAFGEMCTPPVRSTQCAERVCIATSVGCTRVCETDADCVDLAGAGAERCAAINYADGRIHVCLRPCAREADCVEADEHCVLRANYYADDYRWVCGGLTGGDLPAGEGCYPDAGPDAGQVQECQSNVCITGSCSTPCTDAGDCPGTLPTCGSVSTTRPNGVGSVSFSACEP